MFPNVNLDLAVEPVKLKEKLMLFLIEHELLTEVEKNCVYLLKEQSQKSKTFQASISLRYNEILQEVDTEESSRLILHLVVNDTRYFEELLREIVYCHIEAFFRRSQSEFSLKLEQVYVSIRFYDLPLINHFKFSLRRVHINTSLSNFHCLIHSVSPKETFILQSIWKCQSCHIQDIIQRHREAELIAKCKRCLNNCEEVIEERTTSEVISAHAFDVELLKKRNPHQASLTSALELKLFDDLCQVELKIGREYVATGVFDPWNKFFTVWTIVEHAVE